MLFRSEAGHEDLLVALAEAGVGTRTTREIFVTSLPAGAEERMGPRAHRA